MVKEAEKTLVHLRKKYNFYSHKYGDLRKPTCGICKKITEVCPNCDNPFFLPKTDRMPDYALGIIYTWVECKNSDSTGRWNWAIDIGPEGNRKIQRNFFLETPGWLLVELGTEKAPDGKSVYLIPTRHWFSTLEPELIEKGMKSIRKETKRNRPGADELWSKYKLSWVVNEGWIIPAGHIWWKALHYSLTLMAQTVEEKHL